MGLILMLVLSLSVMVQVETVTANQEIAQENAKQNAYLAMILALGELQKTAGPDQRVTARADILENANLPADGSGATVEQARWTGVWDEHGDLLTWLVSGNNGKDPGGNDFHDPKAALTADKRVMLIGEGTVAGGSGSVEVFAPRVTLPEERGSFAYWIGDEGVKAKANRRTTVAATEPGAVAPPVNAALLAPQQFGIRAMTDMGWMQSVDPGRLERLYDEASLKMAAGNPGANGPAVAQRFDDLTVWSLGVLSNNAKGGLKKDLTAGLFGPGAASALSGSIFPPALGGSATDRNPGGPDWRQLRSWATLAPSGAGSLPVRPSTDVQAGFHPVLSTAQFYLMPVYDSADENKVHILVMPAVVLWNPYDRPLAAESYTVSFARNLFPGEDPGWPNTRHNHLWLWQLNINAPGGPATVNIAQHRSFFSFTIPAVSFEPGEAKVFSPPAGKTAYIWTDDPAAGVNALQARYRPGAAFAFLSEDKQNPTPKLGTDTNPANPGGALTDFSWTIQNSRVFTVILAQGTGANTVPLQDSLMLRTGGTGTGKTSTRPMLEYNTALTTSNMQDKVVGMKFVHAFTTNSFAPAFGGRIKWLSAVNPRAATQGGIGRAFESGASSRNASLYGNLFLDGGSMNIVQGFTGSKTQVGHTDGTSNVNSTVLFEASPGREGLWSVGQFMHAPLFRWETPNKGAMTIEERIAHRGLFARFDNLIPAYAVGNSDASPFLPDLSASAVVVAGESGDALFREAVVRYDYSYLLNEALWDDYFLSALPDSVVAGTQAANPRLLRYPDDRGTFSIGVDETASRLMVDGAFNVNSTSVEAWKALLGSYLGQPVTRRSGGTVAGAESVPFIRTGAPYGTAVGPTGINPAQLPAYEGFRRLSLTEIDELAKEIVRQVRLRGPFTNLAQFVNRSLDASDDKELRLRGALAEAIRLSDVNESLQRAAFAAGSMEIDSKWLNTDAEEGWTNENIPGWLSQADIMSRLGSVLSARSDTFRIRSYGEYTVPGSTVSARAWCEAIVQRVPDYVDAANPAQAEPSALNATNREFGRRFVVVSFRWLREEEI